MVTLSQKLSHVHNILTKLRFIRLAGTAEIHKHRYDIVVICARLDHLKDYVDIVATQLLYNLLLHSLGFV